jgi:hypothetical protein
MEWVDVKDKPKEWAKVIMLCKDGTERWGMYEPEAWITPWIIIDGYTDELELPTITHYKLA